MSGPFNCPTLTFAAVLVALGSVVVAIVWAIFTRLED
jgi:hypothetical protein